MGNDRRGEGLGKDLDKSPKFQHRTFLPCKSSDHPTAVTRPSEMRTNHTPSEARVHDNALMRAILHVEVMILLLVCRPIISRMVCSPG